MKKALLALAAAAAFTGSAYAADLPARMPMKAAPPAAPAYSWTGCYVDGGIGYGWTDAESRQVDPLTGAFVRTTGDTGGRGWLGQVGGGCDYEFAGPFGNWVIGGFADYTFSDIHGDHLGANAGPAIGTVGNLKNDWSWAAGGRLGYVVNPTFLTYFSVGYTETHFTGINYIERATLLPTGTSLPGRLTRVGSSVAVLSTDWDSCRACSSRPKRVSPSLIVSN